jgi:acyl carrier protein
MSMNDQVGIRLVELVRETLGVSEVREDASLVMQGASSMRLMQLVARIFDEFDVIVELTEVMDDVTISHIAAIIEERRQPSAGAQAPGSSAIDLPLNDLALPFWEMRHYAPAMAAYNEAVAYLVEGELDVELCRRVLHEIVRSQPALRMAFVDVEGQPRQRELPMSDVERRLTLEVIDVSAERDPFAACTERFRGIYATSFDLAAPPCFRAVIWRLGERRWVLSYVVYHIVADLWSVGVVKDVAARLYRSLLAGGEPEALEVQSLDPNSGTEFSAEDEAYWTAKFQTASKEINLSSRPRPAIKRYEGEMLVRELEGLSGAALEAARARTSVTMASLAFATYCTVLSAVSEETDITVGLPFLIRQQADRQNVVGMFVNILPVRVRVNASLAADDFVRECHSELMRAFRHGRYPAYRIIRKLSLPNRLSRSPLYEQIFTYYEKSVSDHVTEAGLRVSEIELPRGTAKADFNLFVMQAGEKLLCKAEYATAVLSEADAAGLMALFETALKMMTSASAPSLGQLMEILRSDARRRGLGKSTAMRRSPDAAGVPSAL